MPQRIFLAVVVFILLLAILIGAYPFYSSDTIVGESLQRQVSDLRVFGRQPVTVTTAIDLSEYIVCDQETAPLDIIILIDASGSMVGEPLDNAIAGAELFIDTLDFTQHQVSAALFSSQIEGQMSLTTDRALIQSVLNDLSIDSGGTSLVVPMTYARSELESRRRRLGTLPVVLLFSDGAAGDAAQAAQIASQIKQLGGQIFVVGLRGDAFDQQNLATIASGADTLLIAPSSAELTNLFVDIAQIVNSYVLQNVSYTEPIALQNLNLIENSWTSGITPTADGLRFSAEAMTDQEAANFFGFSYQVEPTTFGLIDITTRPSTLSLEACGAPMQRRQIAEGPTLLVLPSLPIVGAFPLGLLLLAALPFLWRRKQQPPSTPTIAPIQVAPQQQARNVFLEWLEKADHLDVDQGIGSAGITPTPTVLVGLGSSGRVVLQQIAERLAERTGETWPEHIRLLQVSLPEYDGRREQQPSISSRIEEVVLARDINRQTSDPAYMQWAEGNRSGTRVKGRLSLFTDLSQGKNESQLWGPMGKVLAEQRNITVWLITDGFGPGSGIIADIAHLLRVRAGSGIIESVRLCLAMQNADWPVGSSASGLGERCYATLRELQRLQLTGETRFDYTAISGQPELQAVHKGKLLDEIYLFDGIAEDEGAQRYDISRLPADRGILRVISNAMLSLLERPLANEFYLNEKNAQSQIARGGGDDPHNYGSALGCAIVRAPIEPTRRLAELRILHAALFDPEEGLWGWGKLDDSGHAQPASILRIPEHQEEVTYFLREVGVDDSRKIVGKHFNDFLAHFLEEKMNEDKSLGLHWADNFLAALAEKGYLPAEIGSFQEQVREWLQLVSSTHHSSFSASQSEQIADDLFTFQISTTSAPTSTGSETHQNDAVPLLKMWTDAWQDAQKRFPKADDLEPEQFSWTLQDEPDLYRQYFGGQPNLAKRLRKRTFWKWTLHPDPALQLVILPPNLADPHPDGVSVREHVGRKLNYYTVRAKETAEIFLRLQQASRPFSRGMLRETYRLDTQLSTPEIQQRLNHNASPLFKTVILGKEGVAGNRRRILMLPTNSTATLPQVQANMQVRGQDPTSCVLFHAHHIIRFGNMQAYVDAKANYQPDPMLFVFSAEQEAAKRERSAKRRAPLNAPMVMSPQGTALLIQDRDVVDSLGKLLLNGNLELIPTVASWFVQDRDYLHDLSFLRDVKADDLLRKVVESCRINPDQRAALIGSSHERLPSLEDQSRMDMQLPALIRSTEEGVRDLAVIIAEALDKL